MNRLNRRIALIGTVFFLISLLISAVALTPDGEALFREPDQIERLKSKIKEGREKRK